MNSGSMRWLSPREPAPALPPTPGWPQPLRRQLRRLQRRIALRVLLPGLPLAAALDFFVLRRSGIFAAGVLALLAVATLAVLLRQQLAAFCAGWMLRRIEAAQPIFEDSIVLALQAARPTEPLLLQLQRGRIRERLATATLADPRPPLSLLAIVLAWALACGLVWIAMRPSLVVPRSAKSSTVGAAGVRLDIHPPAYTGLSDTTVDDFDARVPAGSEVRFTVRASSAPVLIVPGAPPLTMQSAGDGLWSARRIVDQAILYDIGGSDAAKDAGDHRLDVIPDRPPDITVTEPDRSLNLLDDGQKNWHLAFSARDDYGLGAATLTLAHAEGSGEDIKVSTQTLQLEGKGSSRERRYETTIDLQALKFAQGDDLIARLSVADNRQPQPNIARSASFILRWPEETAPEATGIEGMANKTLPTYFRSERQIIIDTEALLAAQPNIAASQLEARADDLGVDQKVLRLRYGQFLGEEFEGEGEHTLAKSAASTAGSASLKQVPSDAPTAAAAQQGDAGFGREGNILAEYGHMHDRPEAATLLDPATKKILRRALDAMWQAELQLRQAKLPEALPFEHQALDAIKELQETERIYLARSGVELPTIDAARRLTGKREDLGDRTAVSAVARIESPLPALWSALANGRSAAAITAADWSALRGWLTAPGRKLDDAIGLEAAADRVEKQPQCHDCIADLRAKLWPLLPETGAAVTLRRTPDAAGAAWLQSLPPSATSAASAP